MTQQEWIQLKEAVSLIAKHCYPDEGSPRNTKNKARRVIGYATKRKQLVRIPFGKKPGFNRQLLLQWAVKKWPNLRSSISIPLILEPTTATMSVGALQPNVRMDVFSSDPEELWERLLRCLNENDEKDAEIQRLQIIESKWNDHLTEDERRRRKARESGKKGGRGNVR